MQAEKQLSDKKFYNSKNILSKLAEMSNKMFSSEEDGLCYRKNNLNIFPMNIENSRTLFPSQDS